MILQQCIMHDLGNFMQKFDVGKLMCQSHFQIEVSLLYSQTDKDCQFWNSGALKHSTLAVNDVIGAKKEFINKSWADLLSFSPKRCKTTKHSIRPIIPSHSIRPIIPSLTQPTGKHKCVSCIPLAATAMILVAWLKE